MAALLPHGYCRGIYTSRRIEIACEERLELSISSLEGSGRASGHDSDRLLGG